MGDIIQVSGNDNVIVTQLREKLQLDTFSPDKKKKDKLVKYIDGTDLLGMFSRFHGENKENELHSAVKSIYKGDKSSLPVTLKTIKGFTVPQIKMFLKDFFSDIGINKNFDRMTKRRLKSHVKRFKYRQMLQKPKGNVQIQLVNQQVLGKDYEDEKKEKIGEPVGAQRIPDLPVGVPSRKDTVPPIDEDALLRSLERKLKLDDFADQMQQRMQDFSRHFDQEITGVQEDQRRQSEKTRRDMGEHDQEVAEQLRTSLETFRRGEREWADSQYALLNPAARRPVAPRAPDSPDPAQPRRQPSARIGLARLGVVPSPARPYDRGLRPADQRRPFSDQPGQEEESPPQQFHESREEGSAAERSTAVRRMAQDFTILREADPTAYRSGLMSMDMGKNDTDDFRIIYKDQRVGSQPSSPKQPQLRFSPRGGTRKMKEEEGTQVTPQQLGDAVTAIVSSREFLEQLDELAREQNAGINQAESVDEIMSKVKTAKRKLKDLVKKHTTAEQQKFLQGANEVSLFEVMFLHLDAESKEFISLTAPAGKWLSKNRGLDLLKKVARAVKGNESGQLVADKKLVKDVVAFFNVSRNLGIPDWAALDALNGQFEGHVLSITDIQTADNLTKAVKKGNRFSFISDWLGKSKAPKKFGTSAWFSEGTESDSWAEFMDKLKTQVGVGGSQRDFQAWLKAQSSMDPETKESILGINSKQDYLSKWEADPKLMFIAWSHHPQDMMKLLAKLNVRGDRFANWQFMHQNAAYFDIPGYEMETVHRRWEAAHPPRLTIQDDPELPPIPSETGQPPPTRTIRDVHAADRFPALEAPDEKDDPEEKKHMVPMAIQGPTHPFQTPSALGVRSRIPLLQTPFDAGVTAEAIARSQEGMGSRQLRIAADIRRGEQEAFQKVYASPLQLGLDRPRLGISDSLQPAMAFIAGRSTDLGERARRVMQQKYILPEQIIVANTEVEAILNEAYRVLLIDENSYRNSIMQLRMGSTLPVPPQATAAAIAVPPSPRLALPPPTAAVVVKPEFKPDPYASPPRSPRLSPDLREFDTPVGQIPHRTPRAPETELREILAPRAFTTPAPRTPVTQLLDILEKAGTPRQAMETPRSEELEEILRLAQSDGRIGRGEYLQGINALRRQFSLGSPPPFFGLAESPADPDWLAGIETPRHAARQRSRAPPSVLPPIPQSPASPDWQAGLETPRHAARQRSRAPPSIMPPPPERLPERGSARRALGFADEPTEKFTIETAEGPVVIRHTRNAPRMFTIDSEVQSKRFEDLLVHHKLTESDDHEKLLRKFHDEPAAQSFQSAPPHLEVGPPQEIGEIPYAIDKLRESPSTFWPSAVLSQDPSRYKALQNELLLTLEHVQSGGSISTEKYNRIASLQERWQHMLRGLETEGTDAMFRAFGSILRKQGIVMEKASPEDVEQIQTFGGSSFSEILRQVDDIVVNKSQAFNRVLEQAGVPLRPFSTIQKHIQMNRGVEKLADIGDVTEGDLAEFIAANQAIKSVWGSERPPDVDLVYKLVRKMIGEAKNRAHAQREGGLVTGRPRAATTGFLGKVWGSMTGRGLASTPSTGVGVVSQRKIKMKDVFTEFESFSRKDRKMWNRLQTESNEEQKKSAGEYVEWLNEMYKGFRKPKNVKAILDHFLNMSSTTGVKLTLGKKLNLNKTPLTQILSNINSSKEKALRRALTVYKRVNKKHPSSSFEKLINAIQTRLSEVGGSFSSKIKKMR